MTGIGHLDNLQKKSVVSLWMIGQEGYEKARGLKDALKKVEHD